MRTTLPAEDSILALVTSERFKRSAAAFGAAQERLYACGDRIFVAQGARFRLARPCGITLCGSPPVAMARFALWVAASAATLAFRHETALAAEVSIPVFGCLGSPSSLGFVWRPHFCSPGHPLSFGGALGHYALWVAPCSHGSIRFVGRGFSRDISLPARDGFSR